MNNFSFLLDTLLLTSSKKKKIDILSNYFRDVKFEEKGWAFSILTNRFDKKYLNNKDLKNLITKRISKPLFQYSYDYVGDLAETISLLWKSSKRNNNKLKLTEFMNLLTNSDSKNKLIVKLESILDESSESQRYSILKIITGGLRVGVSNGIIKEALVKYGCRSLFEIEEYWHGFKFPYIDFFEWLEGKKLSKDINRKELFNSFMLANNFVPRDFNRIDTSNYFSEFKWDGIRAQIIFSKNGKIFSRSGDNITKSFPDIDTYDKDYFVVDGEIVVKKDNKILSFNDLQKRIGRKNISKKLLIELPVHFIAYDILFYKNIDCRNLKLVSRRKYLIEFIKKKNPNQISISKLISFSSWKELEDIRENFLNNHIEGVVIKNKNSIYKKGRVINGWYKWKRKPYSIDFVIMYAQRGHGKRSSFYSDFTFGCWVDNSHKELVPIGKAYSGYTNEELKKLDLWIRSNTLKRFGPVRSIKPGLVVEISFDNINVSSRHKSGVALRFPRFTRIRWDKPLSDICVLKDVKDLIN